MQVNENKESIIAIKSTISPSVDGIASRLEKDKHSDLCDNDIEAEIQGISI